MHAPIQQALTCIGQQLCQQPPLYRPRRQNQGPGQDGIKDQSSDYGPSRPIEELRVWSRMAFTPFSSGQLQVDVNGVGGDAAVGRLPGYPDVAVLAPIAGPGVPAASQQMQ